jgi:hypothetical protein
VNVVPAGYLEDQLQLELVVQHAVAACAAEGVRPDLVSNVQLVSAQSLEESHPHLLSNVPAGGVTEHTYVLSYQVITDEAEADCAHIKLRLEQCKFSEKIAQAAVQHAADNLRRGLATENNDEAVGEQSAPVGASTDVGGRSAYITAGPAAVLAGILLLTLGTVFILQSCALDKRLEVAADQKRVITTSTSSRC